ncbi:glycosyl hydrolase family 61-domain-containing protein [Mycena polygramma]|nr:glycosyl hydrolase family 61-domain-containing protein [Mycena polygramma]
MRSLTLTFAQLLFPLFSLSLVAPALAHGWLGTLTVASTTTSTLHTGPLPTSRAGAVPATQLAAAKPGDVIELGWKTLAEGGRWFHDVGPMMAYLAECGSEEACKGEGGFNASEAEWFKIDEQGVGADGTWAQAKLDTGAPATLTLPPTLAPGNYLLRFEIIALHTAQSPGGAEFYPACAQLSVSGSGTGKPSASELVRLPGAYKATDKGILVAAFVTGGSAAAGTPKTSATTKTSTKAAATAKTTKGASSTKAATTSKTTQAAATHSSTHTTAHAASTSAPKSTTATASPKTCKTSHASRCRRALADAADLEARVQSESQSAAVRVDGREGVHKEEMEEMKKGKKDVKRSRARHLHRLGGPGPPASF